MKANVLKKTNFSIFKIVQNNLIQNRQTDLYKIYLKYLFQKKYTNSYTQTPAEFTD